MADLKGALIGCGFFAINHLHGWRDVAGAGIVALCDSNGERLKAVGDQFAIDARYADAHALFEREKLNFVDIATTAPSRKLPASPSISISVWGNSSSSSRLA